MEAAAPLGQTGACADTSHLERHRRNYSTERVVGAAAGIGYLHMMTLLAPPFAPPAMLLPMLHLFIGIALLGGLLPRALGLGTRWGWALNLLLDLGVVSYAVAMLGINGAPLVAAYFAMILGHGLWLGREALLITAIGSLIGFSVALLLSEDWSVHLSLGIGFLLGLLAIPLLLLKIIDKLHQTQAELRERMAEAHKAATFDHLTDLPNRYLLEDRLEQEIAKGQRHGTRFALLFIDLDGFKHINDTLGHTVGDRVLQQIARRLQGCVRKTDTLARLGGDEFVLLITGVHAARDVERVAETAVRIIREPLEEAAAAEAIQLTASIGISHFPQDGTDAGTLLRDADQAMYQVKRCGKDGFAPHRPPADSPRR